MDICYPVSRDCVGKMITKKPNHVIGETLLRRVVLFVVFATCHLPLTTYSFGAFEDFGWGVRPLGMGGAYTAVADDANGPLFNPSGAVYISKFEISLASAKLFSGLEGVNIGQNYFSAIRSLGDKIGSIGITWHSLYTPALYREDTIVLTYARKLNDIIRFDSTDISLGTNIKYLKHEYDLDKRTRTDPVFENGTIKGGYAVDAGLMVYQKDLHMSLGLSGKNLNEPDIGLKTEDKVTREYAAGLAYITEKSGFLDLKNLTIAADIVNKDKRTYGRSGIETGFANNKYVVRLGHQPAYFSLGFGYKLPLGMDSLDIDYTFAWPLQVENSLGTHRLGVILRVN